MEERQQAGVNDEFIRVSVGIEHIDDIIEVFCFHMSLCDDGTCVYLLKIVWHCHFNFAYVCYCALTGFRHSPWRMLEFVSSGNNKCAHSISMFHDRNVLYNSLVHLL